MSALGVLVLVLIVVGGLTWEAAGLVAAYVLVGLVAAVVLAVRWLWRFDRPGRWRR